MRPTRTAILRPTWCLLLAALAACDDGGGLDVAQGRLDVPSSLDFGDVQVGIRTPARLEVVNVGDAVVRVADIEPGPSFTTDAYAFSLDERTFTLNPGQTRRLQVWFQPFALGAAASSLTLVTDATSDGSGRFMVTLSGQGTRSGLEIVPDPVDFGTVLAGASRTLSVRVFNRLSNPVQVRTAVDAAGAPIIVNEDGRGRFELLSPEPDARGALTLPSAPLEPDEALDVTLRYVPDPSRLQPDVGRWTLRNCDSSLCERRVTLTGEGTNAAIRCQPATVDFGRITPGTTSTRTVTCENVVNEPVTLLGWQLAVDTSPEYRTPPYEGAGDLLPPGGSVEVPVRFTPTQASLGVEVRGTLLVRGRNPVAGLDLSPAEVALRAVAGGPDILVAPRVLSFDRVALGTAKQRRVLIANVGFDELAVDRIAVEGAGFAVDRASLVIPAGGEQTVTVTLTPDAVGPRRGQLIVESNDPDAPRRTVELTGEGVDLPPCDYTVAPASISFGIVQVLRSTAQGVRIQNVGANDCLLNDLRVDLGSDADFTLEPPPGLGPEIVLRPGASVTPRIAYTPQRVGRHAGTFAFYVSSPSAANPEVPLSGFGTESALLVSPNDIDFGLVGVGCRSRTQRVAIYNTGAVSTALDRIERPAGVSAEFVLANLPSGLPGRSIAPGRAVELDVRFEAADVGRQTGVVHIYEEGQTEPYVVSLLGAGATEPRNEDRFLQLETPEVDILFVIDNSCSMSEEQASLTDNFQSFIQFADSQALDYRIGVISTDAEGCPFPGASQRPPRFDQGQCGYFADGNANEQDPTWRLIGPDTRPDPQTAFTAVAAQGTSGSGLELGLEAAYRALSTPLITGWNAGFLRPNAYLALVFVSDEEDQSNNAIDFYVNFFRAIKGFRNRNLLSASAIVGDPDDQCGPVASPGLRYIDVAQQTGGIVEQICTPDWARSLQNLGLSVFGYKRQFFLTNQPSPGSLTLAVDGVDVPQVGPTGPIWSYDSTSNSVSFSPLTIPEPGSEIVVRYRAQCL